MKRVLWWLLAVLVLVPAALVGAQFFHDPGGDTPSAAGADPAQQVAQGRYLARAGDCMACHTARGGQPYAGGRAIQTPFGDLATPNITPDVATGIGAWDADDFWRALHNGKSRDGRFLYPAFPYTAYTKLTRADADALYAYLRTVPAATQKNAPHALRFPYDQRILLAGWRALYFRPGTFAADTGRSAQWNRGAYLVQGAGHCAACHAARNLLGATDAGPGLGGGPMPALGWYAPSLSSDAEAGLGDWDRRDIVALLETGVSQRSAVFGPMAEVVARSLQHLSESDLDAMAVYLKSLPPATGGAQPKAAAKARRPDDPDTAVLAGGERLYADQCAACHGKDGRGMPPAYPPLAGNRAITMASAVNPIRVVLNGGFPPGTQGNRRPYGMPPYGPALNDAEVAAVVSYIRASWGNTAGIVTGDDVGRYRAVPVD